MESPTLSAQERDSMDAELLLTLEEASREAGVNFSLSLFPSALLWTGDSDAFVGWRLKNWLASFRRRTRPSRISLRANQHSTLSDLSTMRFVSANFECLLEDKSCVSSETVQQDLEVHGLQERLKKSVQLDINSANFTWSTLVSLQHTEHAYSSRSNEDDISKAVEVTVNSGGVVFFATFKEDLISLDGEQDGGHEAVAVLKFTSSSLLTQSERLGNELSKHMGVLCPQSRIVYKGSEEWRELQQAAERCLDLASANNEEDHEATCSEFLEALSLSQCVLLMGYVNGCPFLENESAFQTQAAAENTAAGLARIFLLDLVLRNEDRLFCSELGWRGNPANLLCTKELPVGQQSSGRLLSSHKLTTSLLSKQESVDTGDRKFSSADSFLGLQSGKISVRKTSLCDSQVPEAAVLGDDTVYLVTIDSGVPRRPPTGKRAMDKISYPKIVELALNSSEIAGSLLYDISGGKLGFPSLESSSDDLDQIRVVKAFQSALRKGIRDMQILYIFLLKLCRMLQIMLQKFFQSINDMLPSEDEVTSGRLETESTPSPKSSQSYHLNESPVWHNQPPSPLCETIEAQLHDLKVTDHSPTGSDENKVSTEPSWMDSAQKRMPEKISNRGSPRLSKQFTRKLKNVNRTAKVNAKLNEELKRWNEILDAEGHLVCQDFGFVTGFLEGGTSHSVIRNYEFKVRLEHMLERMTLISQGADTERPSQVLKNLFIGGAMAAKSLHTLQNIGVTHVLCLCPSEFRAFSEDSSEIVYHKEIQVLDQETEDISCKFQEACDFLSECEKAAGKCLVHCFEGRSRSATIVLAYLMTHKQLSLFQAWNLLKKVHRRAQPNDGFMQALINLDKQLYGASSMDWQKKKPMLQICDVCGKSIGLSFASLKSHMERFHPETNNLEQE